MKYIYSLLAITLIMGCEMPTENTSSTGEPDAPHTSAEWQIWAYSTAAPAYIAGDATVLGPDMSVLREGSNGWTCLPVNPRGQSDPENGGLMPMRQCHFVEILKYLNGFLLTYLMRLQ